MWKKVVGLGFLFRLLIVSAGAATTGSSSHLAPVNRFALSAECEELLNSALMRISASALDSSVGVDSVRPERVSLLTQATSAIRESLPETRPLESLTRVRFAVFNTENLQTHVGKSIIDSEGHVVRVAPGPRMIDDKKTIAKAEVMNQVGADFWALAEIEGLAPKSLMESFNQVFLEDKFWGEVGQFDNMDRPLSVGTLIRNDLPFDYEIEHHVDRSWFDSRRPPGKQLINILPRDFISVVVRIRGLSKDLPPFFVFFGFHGKSLRDRLLYKKGNVELGIASEALCIDEHSDRYRAAQRAEILNILSEYRERFGSGLRMLIAADFNTSMDDFDMKKFISDADLVEPLTLLPKLPPIKARATHTYHPVEGKRQALQLDSVLMSNSLRESFLTAQAYRYPNARGYAAPLPRTKEERDALASDHVPFWVELNIYAAYLKYLSENNLSF